MSGFTSEAPSDSDTGGEQARPKLPSSTLLELEEEEEKEPKKADEAPVALERNRQQAACLERDDRQQADRLGRERNERSSDRRGRLTMRNVNEQSNAQGALSPKHRRSPPAPQTQTAADLCSPGRVRPRSPENIIRRPPAEDPPLFQPSSPQKSSPQKEQVEAKEGSQVIIEGRKVGERSRGRRTPAGHERRSEEEEDPVEEEKPKKFTSKQMAKRRLQIGGD